MGRGGGSRHLHTVESGLSDTATASLRIGDPNLVVRGPHPPGDRVLAPRRWNTRIDGEHRAAAAQSEDALESSAIHPSRRACVPGPSASAGVKAVHVDVPGQHVGLGLVALERCAVPRSVHRIEQWNSSTLRRRSTARTPRLPDGAWATVRRFHDPGQIGLIARIVFGRSKGGVSSKDVCDERHAR